MYSRLIGLTYRPITKEIKKIKKKKVKLVIREVIYLRGRATS